MEGMDRPSVLDTINRNDDRLNTDIKINVRLALFA